MQKQTILLDTSTLFSGLGWTGPPAQVLLTIHTQPHLELVILLQILDELQRNLTKMPAENRAEARRSIQFLHGLTLLNESVYEPFLEQARNEVDHAVDAPILAAFLTAEVDYLVTSNTTHFPVTKYEHLLSPTQFLQHIH